MRRRQNERRVATLLVRLDVQRTRQAAELERLRNEELARANAALVALDEERNALLDRLREQAQRDALTGLYNRRVLNDRLHEQARAARVRGESLGVVLLDVDRFKHVNDAFSHGVGDEVLRQLAALLVGTCRAQDTVARYGGEEFALLLPDADHATCLRVAERVRSVVEQHDWAALRTGLQVTISAGVYAEVGPTEPERMLAVADAALYAAKDGGRNRVRGEPAGG